MNLFDAADRMESASIRLMQALDLLWIIVDDAEENDPASEYGMTAFVTRRGLYINCLAVLRRELEGIAADLDGDAEESRKAHAVERRAALQYSLAAFAADGVDIATELRGLGYERLGDIPQEKYNDVLRKVKAAHKETPTEANTTD